MCSKKATKKEGRQDELTNGIELVIGWEFLVKAKSGLRSSAKLYFDGNKLGKNINLMLAKAVGLILARSVEWGST